MKAIYFHHKSGIKATRKINLMAILLARNTKGYISFCFELKLASSQTIAIYLSNLILFNKATRLTQLRKMLMVNSIHIPGLKCIQS